MKRVPVYKGGHHSAVLLQRSSPVVETPLSETAETSVETETDVRQVLLSKVAYGSRQRD